MTDLSSLREQTLAAIAAANDEAALEAARVAALGKKGTISALLATLGGMSPDERRSAGAAINALKDEVNAALGESPMESLSTPLTPMLTLQTRVLAL